MPALPRRSSRARLRTPFAAAASTVAVVLSLLLLDSGAATSAAADPAPSPSGISTVPAPMCAATRIAGTPFDADQVNDAVQVGDTVFVAGRFDGLSSGGTVFPRRNLGACSLSTGNVTPFAVAVDGPVNAIAVADSGRYLYLGGSFRHVGGVYRRNAAKISLTGSVLPWNPSPDNAVLDISVAHHRVVLAGRFLRAGGKARRRIASVTAGTGHATPWLMAALAGNSAPGGAQKVVKVVANHQGTLAVAIGNFARAGGRPHPRMVMLRLTDKRAVVARWRPWVLGRPCTPAFPTPDLDVTWAPDDTWFATVATGGTPSRYALCDAAVRWAAAPARTSVSPIAVNWTGGDTLSAIVCTQVSCFVSGHQKKLDNVRVFADDTTGLPRPGIGEIAVDTWTATEWNPTRSRERAMHNVMLLIRSGGVLQGLFIGSDGADLAGEPHNDIGYLPVVAPPPPAAP